MQYAATLPSALLLLQYLVKSSIFTCFVRPLRYNRTNGTAFAKTNVLEYCTHYSYCTVLATLLQISIVAAHTPSTDEQSTLHGHMQIVCLTT